MQMWEYLIVTVNNDLQVSQINGVSTGGVKTGFFSDTKFGKELPFIPYLKDLGEKGWDLVAVNVIENSTVRRIAGHLLYTFKRQKE